MLTGMGAGCVCVCVCVCVVGDGGEGTGGWFIVWGFYMATVGSPIREVWKVEMPQHHGRGQQ